MSTNRSPHSNRIIKAAFGLEIAFNTAAGALLIAAPDTALAQLARSPALVTPTTRYLAQLSGSWLFSFSAPLVLGLVAGARERRAAYWTLGAGEAVLVPVLVAKYLRGTDAGMRKNSDLLGMAGNLGLVLLWRLWCLGWRPQWFGVEQSGDVSLE